MWFSRNVHSILLARLTEHAHLSWQWSTNCIDVSMVEILFYVADILWKYFSVFSILAQTYKVMYIAIYMYVYLQLCIHISFPRDI